MIGIVIDKKARFVPFKESISFKKILRELFSNNVLSKRELEILSASLCRQNIQMPVLETVQLKILVDDICFVYKRACIHRRPDYRVTGQDWDSLRIPYKNNRGEDLTTLTPRKRTLVKYIYNLFVYLATNKKA